MERTYVITIRLVVDEHADDHLQNPAGLRDEIESWLESLGVTVDRDSVNVQSAGDDKEEQR